MHSLCSSSLSLAVHRSNGESPRLGFALTRREINRLLGKLQEKGLTLIPLQLYLKGSRAKVQLGLGRGKKLYDKRQSLRERDDRRQMTRALGRRQKGME